MSSYDALCASAWSGPGGEAALGCKNPREVDMIDAKPGFNPGTNGGRGDEYPF